MTNSLLPIMDSRRYNSDNEDYDSDDYAQTLALGTMMLRKSKEKAFVDASYNRFAWNDPEGLPHWFLDDENKNYRPQLPIPPALMAKMKETRYKTFQPLNIYLNIFNQHYMVNILCGRCRHLQRGLL